MTFLTLATRCLKKIGAIAQSEVPTSEETADIMQTANNMLGQLGIQKLMPWANVISQATFPSSKNSYTIGSGGDFNAVRPVTIEWANIVLTNQSPNVFLPVTLLQTKEWLRIAVPGISTSIPIRAYYDRGFVSTPGKPTATAGLGTIYFNPYPSAPLPDFQWMSTVQFTQYTDASTDYALPLGYDELIEYNLCERLDEFAPSSVDMSNIHRIAANARADIANLNSLPPRTTPDWGLGRSTDGRDADFNWETGNMT